MCILPQLKRTNWNIDSKVLKDITNNNKGSHLPTVLLGTSIMIGKKTADLEDQEERRECRPCVRTIPVCASDCYGSVCASDHSSCPMLSLGPKRRISLTKTGSSQVGIFLQGFCLGASCQHVTTPRHVSCMAPSTAKLRKTSMPSCSSLRQTDISRETLLKTNRNQWGNNDPKYKSHEKENGLTLLNTYYVRVRKLSAWCVTFNP